MYSSVYPKYSIYTYIIHRTDKETVNNVYFSLEIIITNKYDIFSYNETLIARFQIDTEVYDGDIFFVGPRSERKVTQLLKFYVKLNGEKWSGRKKYK